MEKEELKKLFKRYHEGRCTEEEKALLEAWYLGYNEHDLDITPRRINAIGKKIFRELPGNHPEFIRIGLRLGLAAAMIGFLFMVTLKFVMPNPGVSKAYTRQDILPGSNTAILMLANGKKIDLSKATNGQLASQSGIGIYKTASGQIIYKVPANAAEANLLSNNTVTTPRGGQWQIVLPDGSKVWLNSASSLSYPATFNHQHKRIVELFGEAYFEVAKDKLHPFLVKTGQQTVEVLGTHFNINSYADEPAVKTTLAEGSVKISAINGQSQLLLPGQQASYKQGEFTLRQVNVDDALAWTKGSFRFNDQSIQSIMRQLSRWYDIDVQYDPNISYGSLNGRISRFKNLNQVLSALETTQAVHFKVEGRRVTVMK
jgi:transmembrane sensor